MKKNIKTKDNIINENTKNTEKTKNLIIEVCFAIIFVILVAILTIVLVKRYEIRRAEEIKAEEQEAKSVNPIAATGYAGKNGGLFINNSNGTKYYSNERWVSSTMLANGNIITNSNGNTVLKVRTNFSKGYYGKTSLYYYNITTYDINNKKLVSTACKRITTNLQDAEIQIKRNTAYLYRKVYRSSSCNSKQVNSTKVSVSAGPYIIKSDNRSRITTSYNGDKNFTYTLYNNNSGREYYYRWFTYKTDLIATDNISYNGGCGNFKGTLKLSLGLTVSDKYPNRTGMLRIYASKSACQADSNSRLRNGTGNGATIYYVDNATTTYIKNEPSKVYNNNGYKLIRYNHSSMKNTIGYQLEKNGNRVGCYSYALSYGVYIMKPGLAKNFKRSCKWNTNPRSFGATKRIAKNAADEFNIIKKKINQGIPVSIHVKTDGDHWVLVYGYKIDAKVTSNTQLMKSIAYADPWHGKQNVAVTKWPLYTTQYVTWDSVSSAKFGC